MDSDTNTRFRRVLGRSISIAIVITAVVLGLVVLHFTNRHPRTEDAEIFANFIGIAPQVDGPLIRVNVHDNQFVKNGELLYEIDERPYQYALENALSEQAALEGQIVDEQRRIAALVSAVSVSEANIHSAEAEVANAEQGVSRSRAEWTYASNNFRSCRGRSSAPGGVPARTVTGRVEFCFGTTPASPARGDHSRTASQPTGSEGGGG